MDSEPKKTANAVAAVDTNDSVSVAIVGLEQEDSALKKQISTRQFVFMALGGSIGAGLLIASATGLQKGGPGGLVFAFLVVGLAVYLTMCALAELSATFPVQGSFYDYSVRFISPSWGFAMGWNYTINFFLIVPFELTVLILIAKYWKHDLPGVALVPAFMAALIFMQAFGAKWYAEAENIFGIGKVVILITFVITGIVIAAGGTAEAGGRGFENWANNSAFLNGGKGFISVFAAAGMAYGGTEMLGLAVAECKHPRKVMPLASLIVIGRIVVCYLLPLFIAGLVVKPDVFSEPEYATLHAVSPFVVAVREADIKFLPDVINAFLLASVLSMANAAVFAASRALTAICHQGMGPKLFAKTTPKMKLPKNSLLAVLVVAQLAWITAAPKGAEIFDWLLSLASISNFFTWLSICVCHIRLHHALRRQGRSPRELEWRSCWGVWGSYLAAFLILCGMVAQVVSAILPPVVESGMSRAELALQGLLGYVVVLFFWVGHLIWKTRSQTASWREKLLISIRHIALPELDIGRAPDGSGASEPVLNASSGRSAGGLAVDAGEKRTCV